MNKEILDFVSQFTETENVHVHLVLPDASIQQWRHGRCYCGQTPAILAGGPPGAHEEIWPCNFASFLAVLGEAFPLVAALQSDVLFDF